MEWGWSRVIEPVLSELSQCSSPDPRNLRVCAKWLGVRCPLFAFLSTVLLFSTV